MKSSNIEIETDYPDFIMFKTTCQCSDNSHTLGVIVEKQSDTQDLPPIVSLYFKVVWSERYSGNFFQKIVDRLKAVFKILFTGQLIMDEEFMFRDKGQLKDFRNTLEEAINQVEKNNI